MIEVDNLVKSFGDRDVLKGISVNFKPGECSLVIGGSGSGKTVLIKCMVGLYEISSGEVFFDKRSFTQMDDNSKRLVRKEIGMVFQAGALFDSLNVEQNVAYPIEMFSDMSKSERLDRVNFCLNRVNLKNVNQLYPSQISGGMKKRVAIARAIAMNPKYLFCDEPNSGLDPQTSILIDNLIREITQEYQITTVINTHDMNSVLEIGDKVIYLFDGKKEWEGASEDILHADNELLNKFVFASNLFKRIKSASQ
jgi:phospholipid/cholesterol/gamma-HCH transport system ATP-binding protein